MSRETACARVIGGVADRDKSARQGGAQDKAGDDEALGLVGLLGQLRVVGAHGELGMGRGEA